MDSDCPRHSRRSFLAVLAVAANAATAALMGVPVLGYLLKPLFAKRASRWVEAGPADAFQGSEPKPARLKFTDAGGFREVQKTETVWISANGADLTVFSEKCPHVGCNVVWKGKESFEGREGVFFCPCHGAKFDREGTVLAGPPPRPLTRLNAKIENGKVMVEV